MSIYLVLSLPLSGPTYAYTGKIDFIAGDVRVGKEGSLNKASLNQQIQEGETIKTGHDSAAIFTTNDGSQMKMKSDSEIKLTADRKNEVFLNSGAVFSNIKKQSQKHFFIRTRSAVMGVRGTKFFTSYGEAGKHEQDVWMCVNEGLVAITVPGEKSEVLVKEGYGVFVPAGKKATEPKPYEWTKNLNWNMNPEKGDVKDHSEIESNYKDLLNQNYD